MERGSPTLTPNPKPDPQPQALTLSPPLTLTEDDAGHLDFSTKNKSEWEEGGDLEWTCLFSCSNVYTPV